MNIRAMLPPREHENTVVKHYPNTIVNKKAISDLAIKI